MEANARPRCAKHLLMVRLVVHTERGSAPLFAARRNCLSDQAVHWRAAVAETRVCHPLTTTFKLIGPLSVSGA
jgi:hypothetical protein